MAAMMNENSPICASPSPVLSDTRRSCPAMNTPKAHAALIPATTTTEMTATGPGVPRQLGRVDREPDRHKKHRAEQIPQRRHQRFDPADLPRLGDHGADHERPQRHAVI